MSKRVKTEHYPALIDSDTSYALLLNSVQWEDSIYSRKENIIDVQVN